MLDTTLSGSEISLQVATMKNISAGETIFDRPGYIKNNSFELVDAELLLATSNDWISTKLFPSWNVEIVKGIRTSNTSLQYGY